MAATTDTRPLNASGTYTRTSAHELEDRQLSIDNIQSQAWKSWPNEAGFVGLNEVRDPVALKVSGTIPPWTAGTLYRTGPGESQIETETRGTHYVSHWFDGIAQTHKFSIVASPSGDVSVDYSSCLQGKKLIEDIKKRGWRACSTFAQKADPCIGIYAKMQAVYKPSGSNHNVVVERNLPGLSGSASRTDPVTKTENLFVFTDQASMRQIDPITLAPLELRTHADLNTGLNGQLGCAHSQRDPENGDLFNYNLLLGPKIAYRIFRASAQTGKTDILATVSLPDVKPAYIHSMFLTKNFVVLCIPCTHIGWNGVKIPWERNVADAILPFSESRKSQWLVVDRRCGRGLVARFTTPAGFFFHSINAFEEEVEGKRTLYFDAVWYANHDIISAFYYDVIMDRHDATNKHWVAQGAYKSCQQHLRRYAYTLPEDRSVVGEGELVFDIPGPHVGELPTINQLMSTRKQRYVYSNAVRGLSTFMDCLVKTDLVTREVKYWAGPETHTPGEAIFVPRPRGENLHGQGCEEGAGEGGEDDGVLLSVVLDGQGKRSYLLVLDAKTMKEVGRAECEFPVGIGFHGLHAVAVKDRALFSSKLC